SSCISSTAKAPRCPMSSKTGSKMPPARAVRTAAVVTHGKPETIGEALARLERIANEATVELLYSEEEAEKHGRETDGADIDEADLVVVLGGDGTMLRALQRTLGTGPPVVWGLDAQVVTFIAPHSLHARPLVVPRGRDVEIEAHTADVPAAVLVDGRPAGELGAGERVVIRLGEERSLLAHLPESTFF